MQSRIAWPKYGIFSLVDAVKIVEELADCAAEWTARRRRVARAMGCCGSIFLTGDRY